MNYVGDFAVGQEVYIWFNTFDSNNPSASVTMTTFIDTDVHIHKDDSLIQRNNAAGVAVDVDVDGITGVHKITIQTADNTVADFWEAGHDYAVRIEGATVDAALINPVVGTFSVANRRVAGEMCRSSIEALTDQLNFTLTSGEASANNDAYNNCIAIVTDQVTRIQKCIGLIADYVGATRAIVLEADPGIFTMAIGDSVEIVATSALANVRTVSGTTQTAGDIPSDTAAILVDTGTTLDGRIPTALVGGRMDSTVDATGMESGAVDNIWDRDATSNQTAGTFGEALGDPAATGESIRQLVGEFDAAAAAGDPSTAESVMQYVKQLVNVLVGATGVTAFPAEQAPANGISLAEVISAIHADVTGLAGSTMRGTDSGALASVCTEGRLAELDAANLPTTTDDTLTDTAVIGALGVGLTDITDRLPAALTKGTADSGTNATMVDAARTEADTDYWKGDLIRFTSGTISGQVRLITGFTPASDTITFTPVTTQAVATNTYEILPAADINRAILVDTTTTNTDMVGTDSAALATVCTEGRLAELDAANLPTDVDAILVDTNSLNDTKIPDTISLAAINAECDTAISDASLATAADILDKIGAVNEAAAAGDPSATESVMQYVKQLVNILTGTTGITTMPAAAAPANNVSIAEMVRAIYDDTNELQVDWVDAGRLDAILDARMAEASINTTGGAVDTVTTVTNQLTAATVGNQVWDTDATARQTAGTFGQAIGDPGANTETIYDAVVTDATGTNVAADVVAVKAETVLIVADTNELQTDDYPTSIAAIQSDTDDIQTRLPAALVGGLMSSDVTAVSTSATAADNLEESALGIVTGAATGTPTTTVIDTDLTEATTDHYKGRILTFITGAVSGQSTDITGYNGATKEVTVTALTNAPSSTDTFVIT